MHPIVRTYGKTLWVADERQRFTVRASASRIDKGLLAVPQKFRHLFPAQKTQIQVVFDDEQQNAWVTFHPFDPVVKENRIFGLRQWFSKRHVHPGDQISISLEEGKGVYRIALDRYVLERQQQKAQESLKDAKTDAEAEQELNTLSRITRRRPRRLAHEQLLRMSQELARQPRPSIVPSAAERHEGVPPGIRVLLRELHEGKCQLCSFTFEKRNGEPYFEIHHLDPKVGHHPTNLLVLCPNCHAQFEHARVEQFKWLGHWVVGVTINGKSASIRQPLAHDAVRRTLFGIAILFAAVRIRSLSQIMR